MKQGKLLYAGKAKSVYRTDTKDTLIVEFRDDITAFDGGKKEVTMPGSQHSSSSTSKSTG